MITCSAFVTISMGLLCMTNGHLVLDDRINEHKHIAMGSTPIDHHSITRKTEQVGFHVYNQTLKGHTGDVNSVAYSRDGSRIASGSDDHLIKIWNMDDGGALLHTLKGHDGAVLSVAFDDDGSTLVSGSADKTVKVWDMSNNGALIYNLNGHDGLVLSVAYSRFGRLIASGSTDNTIKIWHDGVLYQTMRGHTSDVNSVAFNHDGSRLVSGCSDWLIKIWNTEGALRGSPWPTIRTLYGHTRKVNSVAYNHDGSKVVSGSTDSTIKIWDTLNDGDTGGVIVDSFRGHTSNVISVAYSADGGRIVSGSFDGNVATWGAYTAIEEHQVLKGHSGPVLSVAYNHDGTGVVSGSTDKTIKIWKHVCPPETAPNKYNKLQCEPCTQDGTYQSTDETQCIVPESSNARLMKGLLIAFPILIALTAACHCAKNYKEIRTFCCYLWWKYVGTRKVQEPVFDGSAHIEADNMMT